MKFLKCSSINQHVVNIAFHFQNLERKIKTVIKFVFEELVDL